MDKNQITIHNAAGESISMTLQTEGQRQVGMILIDGVRYHIEKLPMRMFRSKYTVDADAEYEPQTDANGCCVMIAPFAK